VIYGKVDSFDRAIGFVLLPLTTALMVPAEYGVLSLFQTTTEILQYVVALGIFQAFFRYYLEVKDDASRQAILNAAFWQVTGLATLSALVMIPLAPLWNQWLFESKGMLLALMTVPTTYLAVLISLGDCRLQADGRAWAFLKINMLQTVTMRGLSLALLFLNFGAVGWVIGHFAGQCVTMSAFIFLAFAGVSMKVDRSWMTKLFWFGMVLLPLALSHWALHGAPKFIMKALLDDPAKPMFALEQVGLYSVGERIAQIMSMLNLAFALGWRRFAFSNMHHESGSQVLGRGATVFFVIAGFAAMGLVSLGDDLTRWIIAEDYWPGVVVIWPLTLAAFIWGVTEVVAISLYKVNKAYLLSVSYVLSALLCVGLSFLLIPRMGLMGAAQAWMFSEIAKLVLVWILGQREFPLAIGYRRLLLASLVFIAVAVFNVASFPETTWQTSAIQLGLVLSAPMLLICLGFLEPGEKATLAGGWAKLRGLLRPTRESI
jgi:O-antigen/teichoic acid export membrane protein